MANLNSTHIIGNVGGDAELKVVGGSDLATFSVAVTKKWKDRDGVKKELTTWFKVSVWGALAKVAAQYVKKGGLIHVDGSVTARAWIDEKSKLAMASLELRAEGFQLLGGRSGDGSYSSDEPQAPAGNEYTDISSGANMDEIPF